MTVFLPKGYKVPGQAINEDNVLKHLAMRREKNGTPTYANPDMYEIMTARRAGIDIDIDYSPIDSGNDPTVR